MLGTLGTSLVKKMPQHVPRLALVHLSVVFAADLVPLLCAEHCAMGLYLFVELGDLPQTSVGAPLLPPRLYGLFGLQ